ncbi:MAG: DUF4382 domain-containing protein [Cyanobacteria bacterium J06621_12]
MKQLRTIAYGITLGLLISVGIEHLDRQETIAASTEEGTLTLVANGEDFVRQGFISKDGWQIDFAHLYVNIGEAIAYSTESSFEPEKDDTKESIEYQEKIAFLDTATTTDLADGDANAAAITVADVAVPAGFYNALAWRVTTADSNSLIAGNTMQLIGQATKDGQTIDFNLGFNQPTEYVCGEFVGDLRQGIVETDSPGTVEMTFHFDHIFGDADTPPDDALNQDALGFQPLASLASNEQIQLNDVELANQLAPQDYQQLQEAIAGLGHVGEGHCVVTSSQ